MGGANGSRECAPDDKLRDTHQLLFMASMGFAKSSTHPAYYDRSWPQGVARRKKIPEPDQADLACPVLSAKIFRFAAHPNHRYIHRHPVPHEGRFAIVTNVGTGCGGRGSVERAMGSQGGFFRERSPRAQTRDATAYGEVVWS